MSSKKDNKTKKSSSSSPSAGMDSFGLNRSSPKKSILVKSSESSINIKKRLSKKEEEMQPDSRLPNKPPSVESSDYASLDSSEESSGKTSSKEGHIPKSPPTESVFQRNNVTPSTVKTAGTELTDSGEHPDDLLFDLDGHPIVKGATELAAGGGDGMGDQNALKTDELPELKLLAAEEEETSILPEKPKKATANISHVQKGKKALPPPVRRTIIKKPETSSSEEETSSESEEEDDKQTKQMQRYYQQMMAQQGYQGYPQGQYYGQQAQAASPPPPMPTQFGLGMIPMQSMAFEAPNIPLQCQDIESSSEEDSDDCEDDGLDDGVEFSYKPQPTGRTEVTFTVEPKKQPWLTMMRFGFRPVVNCTAPPCYLTPSNNPGIKVCGKKGPNIVNNAYKLPTLNQIVTSLAPGKKSSKASSSNEAYKKSGSSGASKSRVENVEYDQPDEASPEPRGSSEEHIVESSGSSSL